MTIVGVKIKFLTLISDYIEKNKNDKLADEGTIWVVHRNCKDEQLSKQ